MRDDEQIRLTLALYSRYNDYKDEEAWTLLFAPDAVVSGRGGQQRPVVYAPDNVVVTPTGREWRGRNALRAFIHDINARHTWETCHLSGNVVIAIDGDTAKLDADMLFHERTGDGPWRNSLFNRYTADLIRSGSGWLFSRWVIQPRLVVSSRSAELAASAPLPGHGEIYKTLALYAHFLDDHDADNWSRLFAANGRFVLPGGEVSGRDAIKDAIETMWAGDPERRVVHFCTTSVVRADADAAVAETEVSVYQPTPHGVWQALGHGRYYDQLIHESGRWLFQERRVAWPAN